MLRTRSRNVCGVYCKALLMGGDEEGNSGWDWAACGDLELLGIKVALCHFQIDD